MIDLCIDARMAFCSGIGTCIRQLVPLLNQPPFRVILLVDQEGRSWCHQIEQIQCNAPIYSIQEQLMLPKKIPSSTLFWSPHYNIPLAPIRAKKKIVTIHDTCHLSMPYFSYLKKSYARFFMQKSLRSFDGLVVPSYFTLGELQRHFKTWRADTKVIALGVDRTVFKPIFDPLLLQQVRARYQLHKKFFLCVGNGKRHKNLKTLTKAFAALDLAEIGDWNLVLVGKKMSVSYPNILCLGEIPIEDLPAIYNLAEYFMFPSLYEGFGLPPLEAMACGSACLVSHVASLPEICSDACYYFDPTSIKSMTQAMTKTALDSSLKLSLLEKGLERAMEFQWEITAQKYRDFFQKISGS